MSGAPDEERRPLPPSPWPSIVRGRALAVASLGAALVLLALTLAHAAWIADPGRCAPAVAWTAARRHADLCVFPDDDLRHPGWGRAEHGRIAQPRLVDPRLSSSLIAPAPLRVARPPR